MPMKLVPDKYSAELHGVLNCYDRIIITGNTHKLKKFNGPFKTIEEAFNYGFRNFNVVRWSADWDLS